MTRREREPNKEMKICLLSLSLDNIRISSVFMTTGANLLNLNPDQTNCLSKVRSYHGTRNHKSFHRNIVPHPLSGNVICKNIPLRRGIDYLPCHLTASSFQKNLCEDHEECKELVALFHPHRYRRRAIVSLILGIMAIVAINPLSYAVAKSVPRR